MLDSETGESQERGLKHREEAEQFYRALATGVAQVGVGMEASSHAAWFERLLAELKFELDGQLRSERSEYASRRPIGKTRTIF